MRVGAPTASSSPFNNEHPASFPASDPDPDPALWKTDRVFL